MRKAAILFLFLLMVNQTLAQNLYQQDSLEISLKVKGGFELLPKTGSSSIREASVDLLLYPTADYRQSILSIDQEAEGDALKYLWENPGFGEHKFGYEAMIKTVNTRAEVRRKITYPLTDIKGYEQYTLPTAKIDSGNPQIIAKAAELAEGEDDLFKVVFKLANWVSENIEYDLNELTTDYAQSASWVLENRQGVCDEMTSLFVAMVRSLGIPAKFVSGISYTEHEEVLAAVGTNWASHGWAEVYFPDIGWVSFDITFDEYGYIDVTHLKLREGFDPDEPAIRYKLLSDQTDLQAKELDIDVSLDDHGTYIPEAVQLEIELLAPDVDFGSFNLVKGVLKNSADYYAATTLSLAVPSEAEIIGDNKRSILLSPKEVRETYWAIRVAENLKEEYWYEFPLIIYTEKNISAQEVLTSQKGSPSFSKQEIEKLIIQDEEKGYSRQVSFNCTYPWEINVDKEAVFSCIIRNSGDTNLKNVQFCFDNICEEIDLPSNRAYQQDLTIEESKPGWHHLQVSAENDIIEKKTSINFLVVDQPQLEMAISSPLEVVFGESITIGITLKKTSFQAPQNISVILSGLGTEQTWKVDRLNDEYTLQGMIPGDRLQKKNILTVQAAWDGIDAPIQQKIIISGQARTVMAYLKLYLNSILNLFVV